MKNILAIVLLMGNLCLGFAQAQPPQVQIVWEAINSIQGPSVLLTNPGPSAIPVYILLQQKPSGASVQSRAITLPVGMTRFSLADLLQGSVLFQTENPVEWCIRILPVESHRQLGESCQENLPTPTQPPHLVYPFDQEELKTLLPVLSWTPPAPILAGQSVKYKLKMVEVLPYQTPLTAIQSAPAFLLKEDLPQNLMPYTLSERPLVEDQRYAWQIEAFGSGGQFMGRSEVWSFVYRSAENPVEDEVLPNFVDLQSKLSSGFYPAMGKVCFRFSRLYANDKIQLTIYDQTHKEMPINLKGLERKSEDLFILELPPGSGLIEGQYYILKASNSKRETRQMRFRYYYPQ